MSAVASMIIWIKSTSCLIRSFAISSADQSFYIFTQTSLIKHTILPSQMPDFSWFPFRDSSSSLLSRFSICSSSVLSALGEHRRSLFFPFLSLLQIPVLQMISLYRSSPRLVKSIFSSCVCAQRTSFCPSHNSKYKKTARIIFWRPLATKRFLRFFLSFITTKQFYAGITTALICVGLSVFFCTMHNFIGISFALFCAYITTHPLISRKHPGNTWQI